ncbi:MAG: hypothetical protein R2834_20110 [Rhodothermales bacterium]
MAFNLKQFVLRLITESLFYDEEYGALGNLSLIDPKTNREAFIASYVPEDGSFSIEEAVKWEDIDPSKDDEIGYALAVDSKEFATYDSGDEVAGALLQLAEERGLLPSVTLLFEEDEVV